MWHDSYVAPVERNSKGSFILILLQFKCQGKEHVKITFYYIYGGRRLIGISGSLIWSKTLMELILNPYSEF